MRRPSLLPLLLATAPATAQQAPPPSPSADTDGAFGHLAYPDVGAAALVSAPPGFAIGQPCRLQPAAAAALADLLAGFAASGTPGSLHGVSCYRSVAHQRAVFCRPGRNRRCADAGQRAHFVAPPGHSEHETGYALDFAVRPAPGCADVEPCLAATPAWQWLHAHATDYGFELSFPADNRQGIGYEPWHWRWVGVDGEDPAAAAARRVFAAARARFGADPAVPPLVVRVAVEPPPVPATLDPAAPIDLPPPRRRRHRGLFG